MCQKSFFRPLVKRPYSRATWSGPSSPAHCKHTSVIDPGRTVERRGQDRPVQHTAGQHTSVIDPGRTVEQRGQDRPVQHTASTHPLQTQALQ